MKALPILITALALVSSDSSFAIIPSFLNYDDAPTLGYGASLCAYIEGPVDHSVWDEVEPARADAFMNITSRVSGSRWSRALGEEFHLWKQRLFTSNLGS